MTASFQVHEGSHPYSVHEYLNL